jgi:hypothetical protein
MDIAFWARTCFRCGELRGVQDVEYVQLNSIPVLFVIHSVQCDVSSSFGVKLVIKVEDRQCGESKTGLDALM